MKVDILIVGSGCAGLYCALNLPKDKNILIITKDIVEHSDSYLAQGGMCMLKDESDFESYFNDTMKAGHYENNPDAVVTMINSSQDLVKDLIGFGVDFAKDEEGNLLFTREGAHSQNRILFHEDITGKEITSHLYEEAKKRDNITIKEHWTMVDIICQEDKCYGAVVKKDDENLTVINANYTVLASGGIGGIYRHSTNYRHLTGDGVAVAIRHGVKVEHVDYVQIHPTTFYSEREEDRSFLISESVRGEGALLYDKNYKRFTNELLPRDIVTENVHPPGGRRCPVISTAIQQLVNYGLDTGLILPDDEIYIRNQLLMTMQLDSFTEPEGDVCYADLESILKTLVDDAAARGVCDDSPTARDLFDTRLMGVLTPRPSIVRANFEERYETDGPQAATDWFYKFSQDTDYIRRYRIKRDVKWVTKTPYGDLDITINLSKPEKDPKAIAAAKLAPQSAYPKCQLCVENEGYAGRLNHPARENHRIIPLTINDSAWNFQYSPYVYYNEHCIVFNSQHTPMKIERATFRKLLDFVALFPHYFVGSNADLPIVGGSILSHDHFQGGHYEFAMAKAPIEKKWVFPGFEDVDAGIVHWPMSCIRLTCADDERLVELADKILTAWRGYTDESCFVYAETDGEPHNTITPIARIRDGKFQLDLVLRNNITTPEHPLGVYHPHAKLHHIKKENIGLIEVMGLAVLPSRLKAEMTDVEAALVAHAPAAEYGENIQKHAEWAMDILARHPELNAENVHTIVQDEIGHVFAEVLVDAGVYKMDTAGRAGFERFLASI